MSIQDVGRLFFPTSESGWLFPCASSHYAKLTVSWLWLHIEGTDEARIDLLI